MLHLVVRFIAVRNLKEAFCIVTVWSYHILGYAWITTELRVIGIHHADGRIVSMPESGYDLTALPCSVIASRKELLWLRPAPEGTLQRATIISVQCDFANIHPAPFISGFAQFRCIENCRFITGQSYISCATDRLKPKRLIVRSVAPSKAIQKNSGQTVSIPAPLKIMA